MLNERSEVSARVAVNQNGVASGDTGKDDDVTAEKTPDQRLAGNVVDIERAAVAAEIEKMRREDPDAFSKTVRVFAHLKNGLRHLEK
jgi:hypothetical protein